MLKGVVRKGMDWSKAHSDPDYEVVPGAWWDGSIATEGASRTFANGQNILRVGDRYGAHVGWKHIQAYWPDGTPYAKQVPDQHTNVRAGYGNTRVYVEGVAVHLKGHSVNCGGHGQVSVALTGSHNVFVGE